MEYGLQHSTTLNANNNILIVKITGRVKLLNIVPIVTRLLCIAQRRQRQGYAKGIVSSLKNARQPSSDCRFIYFTPDFLPILLAQKENVWPTYGMEWVLGDAIREARKQGLRFVFPPYLEITEGVGMTHGQDLSLHGWRLAVKKVRHRVWKTLFAIGIFPMDGKK